MVKQASKTESTPSTSLNTQPQVNSQSSNTQSNTQSTTQESSTEDKSTLTTLANDKADAVTLLTADHRKVEQLFQQYAIKKNNGSNEDKQQLIKQICTELIVHTMLEEQIFYPACREKGVEDDLLDEAQVEHDGAKMMMEALLNGSPSDEYYDAKVKVLEEYIKHHVKEEEQESKGIFAKARQAGVDMKTVGEKIQSRKPEIMKNMESGELRVPPTRSFNNQSQQENGMSRQSNERERNSRGQFESSDRNQGDRNQQGGGQNAGRYRSYDHDDDGSGSGRGWYGDPQGHSRASEEGWEHSGSSRGGYSSREDFNDDFRGNYRSGSSDNSQSGYGQSGNDYSSGRGQGYGDFDRQSGSSESGWDRGNSRGGYSAREDYGDDYRGSSDREQGNWYGDSERQSRSLEGGWDNRGGNSRGGYSSREDFDYNRNDDRDANRVSSRSSYGEGRGWFGDSQGHSRAAEAGWEHRGGSGTRSGSSGNNGGSNGGNGRGRSSSEGQGRGHGGWFGDSEGHSQAARQRGR